jgi:hypothetical protein
MPIINKNLNNTTNSNNNNNNTNENKTKYTIRPNFNSGKNIVNENPSYNISKQIQEKLRQRSNEKNKNSGFSEFVQNSRNNYTELNINNNNSNNNSNSNNYNLTENSKNSHSPIFNLKNEGVFSRSSNKQYHPFICKKILNKINIKL